MDLTTHREQYPPNDEMNRHIKATQANFFLAG